LRYSDVTNEESGNELAARASEHEDDFFKQAVEFGGNPLGDWEDRAAMVFA
jgi:hypothetical protein